MILFYNLLGILFLQNTYVFPNKNVSIEWNNSQLYNINLSIIDSEWNQIYNQEISFNQHSPYVWNVPNFINDYSFYNKNLLFIKNNNVIDIKNVNNYGVIINNNNYEYQLKTNYECNYFNLSLNKTNNFTIYEELLVLNDSFFGFYDVTITSNDQNLLVYDTINVIRAEEEDDIMMTTFLIITICILGLSCIVLSYIICYYFIYLCNIVCGINLLKLCNLKKIKRRYKHRIHPINNNTIYNNKNKIRRRYSYSDARINYNSQNNINDTFYHTHTLENSINHPVEFRDIVYSSSDSVNSVFV